MSKDSLFGPQDTSQFLPFHSRKSLIEQPDYTAMAEGVAEAARERRDREETNAEHFERTAQALRDMLALTQAENEAARERDRLAQERDAAAKKRDDDARNAQKANLRVAVCSLIAAVLAVIAPFVIEAIKGWQ